MICFQVSFKHTTTIFIKVALAAAVMQCRLRHTVNLISTSGQGMDTAKQAKAASRQRMPADEVDAGAFAVPCVLQTILKGQ